jgi:hypothetical protein
MKHKVDGDCHEWSFGDDLLVVYASPIRGRWGGALIGFSGFKLPYIYLTPEAVRDAALERVRQLLAIDVLVQEAHDETD